MGVPPDARPQLLILELSAYADSKIHNLYKHKLKNINIIEFHNFFLVFLEVTYHVIIIFNIDLIIGTHGFENVKLLNSITILFRISMRYAIR